MGSPRTHERRPPPASPLRGTMSKHRASPRTSLCRGCTSCFPCRSAFLTAPTKAACSPSTSRRTWTSSCSASTDATHTRGACCSSGCSNQPLPAHPPPTQAWPSSTACQRTSPTATDTPLTAAHTRRNTARTSLANPTGRIIAAVTWIANFHFFASHPRPLGSCCAEASPGCRKRILTDQAPQRDTHRIRST